MNDNSATKTVNSIVYQGLNHNKLHGSIQKEYCFLYGGGYGVRTFFIVECASKEEAEELAPLIYQSC